MAEKATRKRAGKSTEMAPPESGSSSASGIPCGACKFLRRRCVNGCIFAPHFSPEQGPALFAAVHKVFGASNVTKLLMQLPDNSRHETIMTVSYEAQARLANPVYGCVSTIISLQQQVAALRMELATVQNQLLNNKLMGANTLQGSGQQLGPMYSNCSSAYNLANDNLNADYSQPSFDPLQLSQPFSKNAEDNEEETGDLFAFADQMLLSK